MFEHIRRREIKVVHGHVYGILHRRDHAPYVRRLLGVDIFESEAIVYRHHVDAVAGQKLVIGYVYLSIALARGKAAAEDEYHAGAYALCLGRGVAVEHQVFAVALAEEVGRDLGLESRLCRSACGQQDRYGRKDRSFHYVVCFVAG